MSKNNPTNNNNNPKNINSSKIINTSSVSGHKRVNSNSNNNDIDIYGNPSRNVTSKLEKEDSNIYQKVDCKGKIPSPRFGHTISMISQTKVVLFGGAVGDTKNFTFSNDTYVLNLMTSIWNRLESISYLY